MSPSTGSLISLLVCAFYSNCGEIANKMAEVAVQIKTHSDVVENKMIELEKEVVVLRQQNEAFKTELPKVQISCVKGMTYHNYRQVFQLWDKVAAMCDTQTDGGGWIVIQRRTKGNVDFYRGWQDYKNGFGTPDTDFWIGNDVIHSLTSQNYTELRIDVEYQGRQYYAQYSHFTVDNEASFYRLSVNGYKGTAGDYLSYNNGCNFTTFDKDNDNWYGGNCAFYNRGGWWYYACTNCNLNGMWGAQNYSRAFCDDFVSAGSLSVSEMKIRLV